MDGSVAEWSKALVLGTSHFDGVGSNPTAATTFFLNFFTSLFSCVFESTFLFYFILLRRSLLVSSNARESKETAFKQSRSQSLRNISRDVIDFYPHRSSSGIRGTKFISVNNFSA